MKIFKLLLPIILILTLTLPVSAMHLPENKVVDREMTVEKDENIISESIDPDSKKEVMTFVMSKTLYVKKVLLPLFMIFLIGPLLLLIDRKRNEKRR